MKLSDDAKTKTAAADAKAAIDRHIIAMRDKCSNYELEVGAFQTAIDALKNEQHAQFVTDLLEQVVQVKASLAVHVGKLQAVQVLLATDASMDALRQRKNIQGYRVGFHRSWER